VIDASPKRILLAVPCGDARIYTETMMGIIAVLAASGGDVQLFTHNGDSNVSHARNMIAHYFLNQRPELDTLFMLDSDITFTVTDFARMMEGDQQTVIAPYARKQMGREPVGFGMGFCRVHRSVFDTLNAWEADDGSEMLQRFYVEGQGIATHFFYTGASPEARWYGEDTGFWHFCARNQITQRLERRVCLGHLGLHKYGYPGQLDGWPVPYVGPGAYPPEVAPWSAAELGFDNSEEPESL
jgi:hypothetical protein